MGRFRDAITGFFTTKAHAKANPHTTVRETIRRPPPLGRSVSRLELGGLADAASGLARTAAYRLIDSAIDGELRSGASETAMHLRRPQGGVDIVVSVTVSAPGPGG